MSNEWESPRGDEAWSDREASWHIPDAGPTPVPILDEGGTSAVTPPQAPTTRRRRRWAAASAAAVLVLASLGVGVGVHAAADGTASTSGASVASGSAGSGLPVGPGGSPNFGFAPGLPGRGGAATSSGTTSASTPATAAQQVGIVDVNTVLGLQGAAAAGTGMVLTSSGEVLTNNHVISGATSITATVVSTGRTYAASVVGYDPTQDVAVLQLKGASGLSTVDTASSPPAIGASVVGVGNAGGAGGTPSSAAGTVLALGQTITASDGASSERLTQLIETDAPIAAGDSGGPLYDSSNQVVGMDTAGSASGTATQAFAIPITRALSVASAIESGQASSTVHVGATAVLGVEVQPGGGALVAGVVSGSPASAAGLVAGDVITSIGGHAVSTSASLSTLLQPMTAGEHVSLAWTDVSGATHHAMVTLASGPAQ